MQCKRMNTRTNGGLCLSAHCESTKSWLSPYFLKWEQLKEVKNGPSSSPKQMTNSQRSISFIENNLNNVHDVFFKLVFDK